MNPQELVSYLDELIFSSTGKHIDSLQMAILKGVLNGKKYADIAQVKKLNFCPNSASEIEENDDIIKDDKIIIDSIQKKTKRETIPRLVKLGLTIEQIAEVLELNIQEVNKIIASQE